MRKKDLILIIICFFIFVLIAIFIGVRHNAIKKQERKEESIEQAIKEEYNSSWLVYKPIIEKMETREGIDTGKEMEIYTARVIYYDLKYTYEDVWIIVVTEDKIQLRKVREK